MPLSPAMEALYRGDSEKAQQLLPDEPDLFEAAAFGLTEPLKRALASDPNAARARAVDDFTAVHLAAFFGHPAALKALIEEGADVNAEATNSFVRRVRPLHSAAGSGDLECARLLLNAGADVDAQQGDGFTPLMEAAQVGDLELAWMFLEAGSDRSIRRQDGTTAESLAREAGQHAVVELLQGHESNV